MKVKYALKVVEKTGNHFLHVSRIPRLKTRLWHIAERAKMREKRKEEERRISPDDSYAVDM